MDMIENEDPLVRGESDTREVEPSSPSTATLPPGSRSKSYDPSTRECKTFSSQPGWTSLREAGEPKDDFFNPTPEASQAERTAASADFIELLQEGPPPPPRPGSKVSIRGMFSRRPSQAAIFLEGLESTHKSPSDFQASLKTLTKDTFSKDEDSKVLSEVQILLSAYQYSLDALKTEEWGLRFFGAKYEKKSDQFEDILATFRKGVVEDIDRWARPTSPIAKMKMSMSQKTAGSDMLPPDIRDRLTAFGLSFKTLTEQCAALERTRIKEYSESKTSEDPLGDGWADVHQSLRRAGTY